MSYSIASVSFGKDSLAMLLLILERNYPIDEVMFFNTGAEFQSVLANRDKMLPILDRRGIKFTELSPANSFEYDAFERPVQNRDKSGIHYGYSWCGGPARWRTRDKVTMLNANCPEGSTVYVGLAFDELKRVARLNEENQKLNFKKFSPLFQWGMNEKDCLNYCYARGWNWNEGEIDLYSVLDRVSCWCCSNKNLKELKAMYTYLPQYWQRLRDFQSRTERPMKQYGTVFELEKRFESENQQQSFL